MVTARSVLLSSSAEKKKNSSMRRRSDVPPPAANYFEGFTEDEVALIRRDMLKWLQDTGHTSVRALRNSLDQTRGTVAPPADIGTPPGVRQDRPAAEATPAGFGGPDPHPVLCVTCGNQDSTMCCGCRDGKKMIQCNVCFNDDCTYCCSCSC
jgi:hypothetical protein